MPLSKQEQLILKSIKIASENNPKKPEYPPKSPKFPATPTYKINIQEFTNLWLKDESYNPTGTHKDRMAWEIVVTYRDFLLSKKRQQIIGDLPHLSLISSGSAAFAIQWRLKQYNLPNLKCLIDSNINPEIKTALEKIGCHIYETDLSKNAYNWKDILKLTQNEHGFDITSAAALDPTTRFYDWLSYEIINNSPDYCFIPFGTGNLYQNILNITKKEVLTKNPDPRFSGNKKKIQNCHFLGATTNYHKTKANKLYSPHLPFTDYDEQWIKLYRYAGYCGNLSDVHLFKEEFLDRAIDLAKKLNINAEPSGLAGLALFLQIKHTIPKNAKILIINTGKTKYGLI